MTAKRQPTFRKPNEGSTIAVVGDTYRFLATGEDTDGRYATWEAIVPPGSGPPPHMAYSESLAERIRQALARRRGITEKKMFGGVGFLLNGNICVGVWKTSMIARLGQEQAESALNEPYVGDFDITGRPMKGWVMVEADGIESQEELNSWVRRSVDFVSKLPKK